MNDIVMDHAVQTLSDSKETTLVYLLENYALISSNAGILEINTGIRISRHYFVEKIGMKLAAQWNNDVGRKEISYSSWRAGEWVFNTRVIAKTDIYAPKVKAKLKTVPMGVFGDSLFDKSKPDRLDSRLSILNVKTVDHSSVGFTGGNIRSLGWAEISAVLSFANLSNIGYLIVRVVHCGDKSSLRDLVEAVTEYYNKGFKENNVKNPFESHIDCGIATVALYDYLATTENFKVSKHKRAEIMGVPWATYNRKGYDRNITYCVQLITDHYHVARSKIYRQISNNVDMDQ
jgi:hypothetical protein